MTPRSQILADWKQRLQLDLAPFCDPGTRLTLEQEGVSLRGTWTQRSVPMEARFQVTSEDGVTVSLPSTQLGYRAFLASTAMGDLRLLATMMLQSSQSGLYVPTKACRSDQTESPAPRDAVSLILDTLGNPSQADSTFLLLITGEAGAGKTSVLRRLVTQTARDFIEGQSDFLFLYIDAQGRALARFNEALATELQDLRASLTYHSVSTLTRNRLIVPVIDGFDELLGASGYDDAFRSLAAFIEELDGSGKIVAAARSSYYEHEFVGRANQVSSLGTHSWEQATIQVRAWGQEERQLYLDELCRVKGLDGAASTKLSLQLNQTFTAASGELGNKPLFIAKAADLLMEGEDLSESGDLLELMVSAYLTREQRLKLLDRTGAPLLSATQLKTLLIEIAEEMWHQETRELDSRSVRDIAEYSLVAQEIGSHAYETVLERAPSLAFLSTGHKPGSAAFEHETFFGFFLAERLGRALLTPQEPLGTLLGRSALPDIVAERAARHLADDPKKAHQGTLDRLAYASSTTHSRSQQVLENAGRVVAFFLLHAEAVVGLSLSNLIIPGLSLAGVHLHDCSLSNVSFRRTNLARTRFEQCVAKEALFEGVLIDAATTRLELGRACTTDSFLGLRVSTSTGIRDLFDPSEISVHLLEAGIVGTSSSGQRLKPIPDSVLKLLDGLTRAFLKANPICLDDQRLARLSHDPSWQKLEGILLEAGVVTEETRTTGGPTKRFLRRQVLPEAILAGRHPEAAVPASVRSLWDLLEDRFGSHGQS